MVILRQGMKDPRKILPAGCFPTKLPFHSKRTSVFCRFAATTAANVTKSPSRSPTIIDILELGKKVPKSKLGPKPKIAKETGTKAKVKKAPSKKETVKKKPSTISKKAITEDTTEGPDRISSIHVKNTPPNESSLPKTKNGRNGKIEKMPDASKGESVLDKGPQCSTSVAKASKVTNKDKNSGKVFAKSAPVESTEVKIVKKVRRTNIRKPPQETDATQFCTKEVQTLPAAKSAITVTSRNGSLQNKVSTIPRKPRETNDDKVRKCLKLGIGTGMGSLIFWSLPFALFETHTKQQYAVCMAGQASGYFTIGGAIIAPIYPKYGLACLRPGIFGNVFSLFTCGVLSLYAGFFDSSIGDNRTNNGDDRMEKKISGTDDPVLDGCFGLPRISTSRYYERTSSDMAVVKHFD